MDNDTLSLFKEYMKNIISFDKYCSIIDGAGKYKKYLDSEKGVLSGMIKWPDKDNPDCWASAYPGNYVAFVLYGYSNEQLLTPVEIYKRKKSMLNMVNFSIQRRFLNDLDGSKIIGILN